MKIADIAKDARKRFAAFKANTAEEARTAAHIDLILDNFLIAAEQLDNEVIEGDRRRKEKIDRKQKAERLAREASSK